MHFLPHPPPGGLDLPPGEPPAEQGVCQTPFFFFVRNSPPELAPQKILHLPAVCGQLLQSLLPQLPGDALFIELLPDPGGTVPQLGAVPDQGGGVFRVIQGPDGLQPFGGVAGLRLAGPLLPELPLQIPPAHGPLANEVRRRRPGVGNPGGLLQPPQDRLVQLVPGAEAEVQQLLLRDFQAGPVLQKEQDAALLVLGGFNPLYPHGQSDSPESSKSSALTSTARPAALAATRAWLLMSLSKFLRMSASSWSRISGFSWR